MSTSQLRTFADCSLLVGVTDPKAILLEPSESIMFVKASPTPAVDNYALNTRIILGSADIIVLVRC